MENFDLKKALRALSDGKLVVYPTDTLYGLGADIFNIKAVNKAVSYTHLTLPTNYTV